MRAIPLGQLERTARERPGLVVDAAVQRAQRCDLEACRQRRCVVDACGVDGGAVEAADVHGLCGHQVRDGSAAGQRRGRRLEDEGIAGKEQHDVVVVRRVGTGDSGFESHTTSIAGW